DSSSQMIKLLLSWVIAVCLGAGPSGAVETSTGPAERPSGTGVIVHGDGYVLTAHHVVANARRIIVVTPGEFRAPAVIVGSDPDHDVALLKMETIGLSDAPIGYAGAVTLDQEVIVAGFPFGLREVTISHGRISAVRTKGVKRVFQVDAAINPGNSGGPVFNRHGEVVALITTKFSHPSGIVPEGMAFAVPVSYALPLLANIPDFDFAAIGKSKRDTKSKSRTSKAAPDAIVRNLSRTTVRIETLRLAESTATPAGSPESGPNSSRAEARRAPSPKAPVPAREPVPNGQDETARVQVNEQIATAQRQELQTLTEKGVAPPPGMVLIPAGEFLMGEDDGHPDARPMHRTTLSSYWIDQYEVTNAQYRRCVDSGICPPPRDRQAFDDANRSQHPATNVTWKQAHAYCRWRGNRLPTEAQWEKAARGIDGRRYPWGNNEDPIKGWSQERAMAAGNNGTSAVGSVADTGSPYGVHDLVGNAWEWVKDWYAEDYYAVAPRQDPQGPLRGSFRVLRGGDWSQSPLDLRASTRAWDEMSYWGPTLGFRCADDVP
ncbi:MAG TPA: SUMF1/EgtB/PvdO family nonheme iron enzyme, partial [Nitrospiraceae bacterium]|nr:SUMF1/EgtB/PvdO family nonheme iron enzyme [Nitrospiraceae bacterium]